MTEVKESNSLHTLPQKSPTFIAVKNSFFQITFSLDMDPFRRWTRKFPHRDIFTTLLPWVCSQLAAATLLDQRCAAFISVNLGLYLVQLLWHYSQLPTVEDQFADQLEMSTRQENHSQSSVRQNEESTNDTGSQTQEPQNNPRATTGTATQLQSTQDADDPNAKTTYVLNNCKFNVQITAGARRRQNIHRRRESKSEDQVGEDGGA